MYRLIQGVYRNSTFEIQVYLCSCGSTATTGLCGTSCIVRIAVTLNASESSCTAFIAHGGSFSMDDWGAVTLMPGGIAVDLPPDVQSSPELTGLLTAPPLSLNQSRCSEALQPLPSHETLFPAEELQACEVPADETLPLDCDELKRCLQRPECPQEKRLVAVAACSALRCQSNESYWMEDCIADHCAGATTAFAETLANCNSPSPPPTLPPPSPLPLPPPPPSQPSLTSGSICSSISKI